MGIKKRHNERVSGKVLYRRVKEKFRLSSQRVRSDDFIRICFGTLIDRVVQAVYCIQLFP